MRLALTTLRARAQLPLMVLCFGRPEIDDLFQELRAHPALHRPGLTDLTKKSCQELIRRALGPEVAPEIVAGIVARSGGNAYYLEEMIEASPRARARRCVRPWWRWPRLGLSV